MTVSRDAFGVPTIRGTSIDDLAFEQGRATAADRGGQIELDRLHAEGRTAEVRGIAGADWDAFARRSLLAETARECFGRTDTATQRFCAAYVAGVEAGLAHHQRQPGTWAPWTPMGIFLVQHVLFGAFPTKLWRARVVAALGDDALDLIGGEGPALSGSNAWVAGGGRTASGSPLIAGDPHRVLESPGVYQQVRLVCPDVDVVGLAFPGVPGVQHFAHAGDVAWAITNAMADYEDLFVEQLRRTGDGVEARGAEGWYAADVRTESIDVRGADPLAVEIVVTRQGPVVIGGPDQGEGLSLRTTARVGRDLGFGAIIPLLRATSVDDVDRALDRWVLPVNNVVTADRTGRALYRVAGRVPRRDEQHAWTGWVDPLPSTEVGPGEVLVTANERRGPESDAIGHEFAPPHRAERLRALLDGRDDLTADDAAAFHVDTELAPATPLRALLERVDGLGEAAQRLRADVLAWDVRMEAGSPGAAAFAAVRGALVRRLADQPAFAALREPSPYPALFDPWVDLTGRLGQELDRLLGRTPTPWGIDLAALAGDALDEVALSGVPDSWGSTHVWAPAGVPAVAMSGDTECVLSTSSVPGVTDSVLRGPVARYVWDLADRDASRWIVPLGTSEDPSDPHHHDQLEHWVAGRLVPVPARDDPARDDPAQETA
ncbi:penicillin acylase family protein [Aeromicrobium endophyticum]|uniref:Penicillin acylase family protein n=1 Tax=Aeromicrobium endophyticum TaxID=2292704 RepID=A0A371P9E7_9ACTN|nr:penicillin acylase family protein [Aeromicrobium endophyticum]REK72583.1 penicillin acylase family protein [Aeromicrobium endophyticum]